MVPTLLPALVMALRAHNPRYWELAPTVMSMAFQSLAQLITSADAAAVDASDAAAVATPVDAADAVANLPSQMLLHR